MKKSQNKPTEFTNDAFGAMDHFLAHLADEMLEDQAIGAEIKGRIRIAKLRYSQESMSPNEIRGFLNSLPGVEITTTIEFV